MAIKRWLSRNSYWLLILIVFITLPVLAGNNAREEIAVAQQLFNQKNYIEAVQKVNAVISQVTDQALLDQARNILGWSYWLMKDYDNAFKVVDELRKDENSRYRVNAIFLCGAIKEELGNAAEACSFYSTIVNEFPQSNSCAEAKFKLARLYIGLDSNAKASLPEEVKRAVPVSLYLAGEVYLNKRNLPEKALECYKCVVDEFPGAKDYTACIFLCGKIKEQMGDLPSACSYYANVINNFAQSNSWSEANFRFAEVYKKLDTTSINKLPNEVKQVIPQSLYLAGEVYLRKRNQPDKAIYFFDEIVDKHLGFDKWDDALMLRGRCLIKLELYEEALELYHNFVSNYEYNNHTNEAQCEVVRILLKLERYDELGNEAKLLTTFPHPRGRLYGALAYIDACVYNQKYDEAIKFLEDYIDNNPSDPFLYYYQNKLDLLKAEKATVKF